MVDTHRTTHGRALHPLHAILLAFPLPLFLGALLSDWAYSTSYQVQWTNFASWLIAGALLGGGLALLWALIEWVISGPARTARHAVYFLVLLAMWVLGFINALVHAKDAWAAMPAGLWLSAIVTVLALVASLVGYSGLRGGVK
ncbi:DUF2231 domain-containing protein [Alloalcanivorax marinus]|uniref:DUF2231 domain-containing protein n=1 Tax=Alloalcanivorax marinus TaxID=1177169 RepID=UPI001956F2BA|nr:DUF2231 domain-containing protein [Alloalcanivorax marinus]MBM7334994.1 hypothetical protein [Alloalcanivorax marinus]